MSTFSFITVFSDFANDIRGNVSSVVLMENEKSDKELQAIASDFNQPATTFLWETEERDTYYIRWFAPDAEIPLCGHGTFAATAFLSQGSTKKAYTFLYPGGTITGKTDEHGNCEITLAAIQDFDETPIPEVVREGLGVSVKQYFKTSGKHLVLLESEEELQEMKPLFHRLRESDTFAYTVTAPGNHTDFVSRTLVPHVQQLEDHATGSSHAVLVPFWAKKLDKTVLTALQLSRRGGKFKCLYEQESVTLRADYEILNKGTLV